MEAGSIEPRVYILRCETLGYHPNFWLSETYFKQAGWVVKQKDDFLHVYDSEGVDMLPPVPSEIKCPHHCKMIMYDCYKQTDYIWAMFPGMAENPFGHMWASRHMQPLDQQFIFNPTDFNDMSGGEWATFRKNCRKFPTRYENKVVPVRGDFANAEEIEERMNILVEWLSSLGPDAEIYDDQTLVNYCQDPHTQFHGIMDLTTEKMLAVNIYDTNYAYVNYRYCLCKNLPYLSEYARLQFYLDGVKPWQKVNDGGSLGKDSLREFKAKMNPEATYNIFTFNHQK